MQETAFFILFPVLAAWSLYATARRHAWVEFWLVLALVGMFVGIAMFNLHEGSSLRDAQQGVYR